MLSRVQGLVLAAVATAILVAGAAGARSADGIRPSGTKTGPSGLLLPRFVSLKSSRVNVRKGPSLDHPVAWEFKRAGLPVEVINESENWRRVRDSEGSEGWVFHSLLSGRRTVLVAPWMKERRAVPLRSRSSAGSPVAAQLEPGVLGSVLSCDGEWCHISVDPVSGWVEQEHLWGVYRGERIE